MQLDKCSDIALGLMLSAINHPNAYLNYSEPPSENIKSTMQLIKEWSQEFDYDIEPVSTQLHFAMAALADFAKDVKALQKDNIEDYLASLGDNATE